MTRDKAERIAEMIGGTAHHTGGGHWVVRLTRPDGRIVEIGESGVMLDADSDTGTFEEWTD